MLIKEGEHPLGIKVSVQDNIRVVQTVMVPMGLKELLVGQLHDSPRVSARLKGVAGIREQGGIHGPIQNAVRIGKCALHLVEHHTVVAQGAAGALGTEGVGFSAEAAAVGVGPIAADGGAIRS